MARQKKFASFVWQLCNQNIRERFAGSILGAVWMLVWPLVQLLIYMLIFGKFMGTRLGASNQIYSYGLYVAAGLLVWSCFSQTLLRTCRVFVEKRHIIGKVKVDLMAFPLAICLEEMLPLAAGLMLLLGADICGGWRPSLSLAALAIIAFYCQQVLALGLGIFLGCCAVFVRDTMEIASIGMQMAFWFTPIVYMPSILPQWLGNLLWLNPMTDIVCLMQQFFVTGGMPQLWHLAYAAICAHAMLALGLYALKCWQGDIRDVL